MLLGHNFHGPGLRGVQHVITVTESFVPLDRTNVLSFTNKYGFRRTQAFG